MPQWENVPEIEALFCHVERWADVFRDLEVEYPYAWKTRRHPRGYSARFAFFIAFIDLGPILMGVVPFFTLLGREDMDRVAQALMEKSFQISTGLSDYLRANLGNPRVDALGSLVGDFGTFLSPRTYEKYSLAYDRKILERYGRELPCNLHSCGPSAHLYDYWVSTPTSHSCKLGAFQGRSDT